MALVADSLSHMGISHTPLVVRGTGVSTQKQNLGNQTIPTTYSPQKRWRRCGWAPRGCELITGVMKDDWSEWDASPRAFQSSRSNANKTATIDGTKLPPRLKGGTPNTSKPQGSRRMRPSKCRGRLKRHFPRRASPWASSTL